MKTLLPLNKIVLFVLLLASLKTFSATVDTVSTFSPSMQKQIKALVIKPDSYDGEKKYPVVYLLHGYTGNFRDWAKYVPGIKNLVDQYQLMLVSADGSYGSWYFDSPKVESSKYETYISKELVNWVDKNYKTIPNKKNSAITGLSMGGHGAFYIAFKHQDIFSIAGSISGGVDFRLFPLNWDIAKYLGTYAENKEIWDKNTVMELTHLLIPNSLALIFQCGIDDFFYDVNVKLHEKLLLNNIPHAFIANPGGHSWDYWKEGIQYQLLFIHNHFEK